MTVNPNIQKKANDIRTKTYGKEVRESLASGLEEMSKDIEETKGRQDSVEAQFQSVIEETRGKDVISSPEITAALVSHTGKRYNNLKERLDKEHQEVTSQFAQTEKKLGRNLSQFGKGSQPVVTFVLDDGKIEDLTKIYPIAQSKNVPFSSAIITSRIGQSGYMTGDQIKELHESGYFEILSHTHKHERLVYYTVDELRNELETSISVLNDLGIKPNGFVYPYNEFDRVTISVVQEYFDFAFARHPFTLVKNHPRMDNQVIDRVSLGSYYDEALATELGFAPDSLDYYKYRVDEAIRNNSWLVFVLHPGETPDIQFTYLEQLIDYIKSKGVAILKPTDGFNIQGNIIQTRNFAIDKNGLSVSKYGINVLPMNSYRANDPITDYQDNSITIFPVNSNGSEGFPANAGTVTTYRLDGQVGYTRQEFRPYQSQNTYIRSIDLNGNWREWETLARTTDLGVLNTGKNSFTATDPISAYRNNKITMYYVDSNGSSGFPANAGSVITYRVGDNAAYSKQFFFAYNSRNLYYRYAKTDGTWGEWNQFAPSPSQTIGKNLYTASAPITDYPVGITTFYVTSSGSEGFPRNAGIVTTYRIEEGIGYGRQEFRVYQSYNTWVRNVTVDGVWSDWKEVALNA